MTASVELLASTHLPAFVVVLPGRAVGVRPQAPDHARDVGNPVPLGLAGNFDLRGVVVDGVTDVVAIVVAASVRL